MRNTDPCRGCKVYKEVGCSHVDSYLCDFPACSMLQDYINEQEDLPPDMQKVLGDNLSDLYEE